MDAVTKQVTSGSMHFWETWDLRLAILFSLFLQIFLIFSAPLRKRTSKGSVLVTMWFAYLLADATAIFAAGLIIKGQGETYGPFANPGLVAFWAPFLLLHLGGPDSITAFALEDNELWLRHLLGLGFPCWAVAYAFFLSFPKSELRAATLLIFIAGLIKYIERTRCLYLASSRRLKDSVLLEPGTKPNYAKLMDEYIGNPTTIEMIPEPTRREKRPNQNEWADLSDLDVLHVAHNLLTVFLLPLLADLKLSISNCSERRDFFLKRTAQDAFKVVEVELNFLYDMLYTKAVVVYSKLGFLVRIFLFSLNFSSLAIFYFMKKRKFEKFDIGITYTLLLGAIALDLIASLMALYSNWTAMGLTKLEHPNWGIRILVLLSKVNRIRWPREKNLRWSECLTQFNFLDYLMHPRSKWWEKTIGIFGLTNTLDARKYGEKKKFTDDLRDLIFGELKLKSEMAKDLETAKKIYSARGNWILEYENHSEFLHWINDVEFDESLLLWHIATELCFNTDDSDGNDDIKILKDISKLLSDYMLYHLILESPMIATLIDIGQIRFRDIGFEAKKFFEERNILTFAKCCFLQKCCCKGEKELANVKGQACKSILDVNTSVPPVIVEGDRSKSMMFLACILAKELKGIPRETMWKLISKVWVELLSYAACCCRPKTHAAQLGKGGQLMTLVWMLMAHLGLVNQFRISDQARAKLAVV